MLKNVPKLLSPELLKIMSEMGHGDEIVIADANFPSNRLGARVIRADGLSGCDILEAIMQMFPLDTYSAQNAILMEVVKGDTVETPIWGKYSKILSENDDNYRVGYIERYDFYERAKSAYAIVASGESALYANIILKKGVL